MTEPLLLAVVFLVVLWLYEWVNGIDPAIRGAGCSGQAAVGTVRGACGRATRPGRSSPRRSAQPRWPCCGRDSGVGARSRSSRASRRGRPWRSSCSRSTAGSPPASGWSPAGSTRLTQPTTASPRKSLDRGLVGHAPAQPATSLRSWRWLAAGWLVARALARPSGVTPRAARAARGGGAAASTPSSKATRFGSATWFRPRGGGGAVRRRRRRTASARAWRPPRLAGLLIVAQRSWSRPPWSLRRADDRRSPVGRAANLERRGVTRLPARRVSRREDPRQHGLARPLHAGAVARRVRHRGLHARRQRRHLGRWRWQPGPRRTPAGCWSRSSRRAATSSRSASREDVTFAARHGSRSATAAAWRCTATTVTSCRPSATEPHADA